MSKHIGKTYTLTGREALSGVEQARIFSRHLHRQIIYHDIPPEKEEEAMVAMGMPEILVKALSQLHSFCQANKFAEVSPDVETVLDRPPISFDRFVEDFEPPIVEDEGFPYRLLSRSTTIYIPCIPDRPPLLGCFFNVHGRTDRQRI
ncbi:MAG: hypothetical protein AB4368_10795 [Xenococcaceae cyanobacterium]